MSKKKKGKKETRNRIYDLVPQKVQSIPNSHKTWYEGDMPTRQECLERLIQLHDMPVSKRISAPHIEVRTRQLLAYMQVMGYDKPEVDNSVDTAALFITREENEALWEEQLKEHKERFSAQSQEVVKNWQSRQKPT